MSRHAVPRGSVTRPTARHLALGRWGERSAARDYRRDGYSVVIVDSDLGATMEFVGTGVPIGSGCRACGHRSTWRTWRSGGKCVSIGAVSHAWSKSPACALACAKGSAWYDVAVPSALAGANRWKGFG